MKALLMGLVARQGLSLLAGMLLSGGLLDQDRVDGLTSLAVQALGGEIRTAEQVTGALAFVAACAWSAWQKWRARQAVAPAVAVAPAGGG